MPDKNLILSGMLGVLICYHMPQTEKFYLGVEPRNKFFTEKQGSQFGTEKKFIVGGECQIKL